MGEQGAGPGPTWALEGGPQEVPGSRAEVLGLSCSVAPKAPMPRQDRGQLAGGWSPERAEGHGLHRPRLVLGVLVWSRL